MTRHSVPQVFLLSSYSSATSKSEGEIHMGRSPGAREERALDACRTLLTRRGLEATGAIPCVISTCGNWMVPVDVGQRVQCSACLVEFCRRWARLRPETRGVAWQDALRPRPVDCSHAASFRGFSVSLATSPMGVDTSEAACSRGQAAWEASVGSGIVLSDERGGA